jgi:hypothetical protein
MKTIIKNTIITTTIAWSLGTHSLIVSDPSSYGYYVEQLQSAAKELTEMKNSVNQAKTLNTSFDGYMRDLRQEFNLASTLNRTLGVDIKNFDQYASGLSSKSRHNLKYNNYSDDLKGVINANIDGIFIDPNDDNYVMGSSKIQELRTFEQQRLRKKGLVKTEQALISVGARLDRIKDLSDKANTTTTIKMSQDLTNAILLELLATNNEMLKIFSILGQAEMASQYINYSKEAHEKAQAELVEQNKGYTVAKWQDKCREFERKNGDADATFLGRDCYWKAMIKIQDSRGDIQSILDADGI